MAGRGVPGRGARVEMRRVRVVAKPASDYVRFEHAVTDRVNIARPLIAASVPNTAWLVLRIHATRQRQIEVELPMAVAEWYSTGRPE